MRYTKGVLQSKHRQISSKKLDVEFTRMKCSIIELLLNAVIMIMLLLYNRK